MKIAVTINKVYDKQRLIWFLHLKYKYALSYTKEVAEYINYNFFQFSFPNLTEEEVRYLQQYICKLTINSIKMPQVRKTVKLKPSNGIDISPQPGDEPKQEPLDLFHVTFTKIIHYDEMLNERQIQALLKDKHVKSININK